MHFFLISRNKSVFFHEISVILHYCLVWYFQDFERSSKCLLYDIKRGCSKNCSECVQVLRGGEAVGSQYSLERASDRTTGLTGVSRATGQRTLSKKVELPSPLIDQAPTVTKVALDDRE